MWYTWKQRRERDRGGKIFVTVQNKTIKGETYNLLYVFKTMDMVVYDTKSSNRKYILDQI